MTGPIETYRSMVNSGALRQDMIQALAAEKLQMLHNRLMGYEPGASKGGLRGLLRIGAPDPPPTGLYIYGDVGRGKSMLMDLFYDTAPVEPKRRVHFHEFMQEVHGDVHDWRQKHKRGEVKGDDPIAPVAEKIASGALLLCFDEFQVTDITDAMILSRLFSVLFEQGVVVVSTSNRAPDTLYENGLNRALFLPFIAMLKERLDILELEGETDYRLERMAGAPVFYTPVTAANANLLQAAWERLTDTTQGETIELPLKGRTITVPQSARGVARFSFEDLCEKPLGPADYLKIAISFHTVIVDGIPVMTAAKRNEAKRFVTLIDALYEKKVKLIASAEAEASELYREGDGSFEFARTASRMIEMQSHDYLAAGHGGQA